MSSPGRPGDNPFEGMPIFGDLARLFASQGPISWQVARQLAHWLATDGQAEDNVDPLQRMRYEELLRVADLHAASATGLSTSLTGRVPTIVALNRSQWASRALDDFRPLLERLAAGIMAAADQEEAEDPAEMADPQTELMGTLGKMLGPVLLGMQSGFMVGHLAKRSLGQYDVAIPRPRSDELVVVPANLDGFAEEWSLPLDDLRLWVCFHDVLYHSVLGLPHVGDRLDRLLAEYATGFEVDPDALEASLGDIDPTDPLRMQAALSDPETLLGALRSPAQEEKMARIQVLMTTVAGYVDHVMDRLGTQLIGSYGKLTEALRRRRVETTDASHFVERLLGIELGREQYRKGAAFMAGVVERAGEDALGQLWTSEERLPTAPELDAPGLWLARIAL